MLQIQNTNTPSPAIERLLADAKAIREFSSGKISHQESLQFSFDVYELQERSNQKAEAKERMAVFTEIAAAIVGDVLEKYGVNVGDDNEDGPSDFSSNH